MKFRILILLIIFSWNLTAQNENYNQVKIKKHELGIGRDLKLEFKVLESGVYSKDFLPIITIYKLVEQELEQDCNVISKYGKGFEIKVTTNYKYNRNAIENISKLSNPIPLQYLQCKFIPELRFATRKIIGNYTFDGLDLNQAEIEILDFLKTRLQCGVIVNSIKIEMIKNK